MCTSRSLELGEIWCTHCCPWDHHHWCSLALRSRIPIQIGIVLIGHWFLFSIVTRPVYAPVASPAPPSPATHQSATSSEIVPQLQNIVRFGVKSRELLIKIHVAGSTVNMGVKLDLKKIALHARNAEYNPKRFAAVIMRIRWVDHYSSPGADKYWFLKSKKIVQWLTREPRTTALIFSSGKMVCTGAKSEEDSR